MRSAHFLVAALIGHLIVAGPVAAESVSTLVTCDPAQNLALEAAIDVSSEAGGDRYSRERAIDNDLATCWASEKGARLPQWIELRFAGPTSLTTLVVIPRDLPDLYANPRTVQVSFSDGPPIVEELDDRATPHFIRFDRRTTTSVRLTITGTHSQNVYVGLCELMAFDDPQGAVGPAERPEAPLERWRNVQLIETGREQHPCVYVTREDVERARRNIERHDWARDYADAIIARADSVVDHSPKWIHENTPEPGACFACGKGACPVCGAPWTKSGGWGGWASLDCSFERPGTVRCENGHILPGEQYPDPGTGYVTEDGRVLYFVGSYNAWVVENYMLWCRDLAFAYSITGDERYANTCAVILDALAEIYPHCTEGSWDYPSDPPSGRLARPWYQVARYLVPIVDAYDQIHDVAALNAPSFVNGMTRRENIETNMLKDGAWYCYEQSLKGSLHNGEADYIRGALAVGCLLGIEHYVDWAVDGPYGIYAMIHNNADRDGRYTESSLMYALHARNLYLTFSEPLVNYRSEKYPNGLNLYDDPAFRAFYVLPALSLELAGHMPRYGDVGPDTGRELPPAHLFDSRDYQYAERIAARSTIPGVRNAFASLVSFFADGDLQGLRSGSSDREWLLFHSDDGLASSLPLSGNLLRQIQASHNFGQKGIAVLRTPDSPARQACLLRYGPSLNHGHLDDLNINYVALGWEVTYDLGYGDGATPTQRGWAKQTASHNLVLVDELPQLSGADDDSGGSLHLFAGMPGLQVVDADADAAYRSRGVEEYRRLIALVGDGPGSYLLDIFRVEGGAQHDYVAHALSDDATVAGVDLAAPEEGSLAGPGIDWGARQMADGYLSGVPHERYWNPPPGNGLGFMMNPERGATDGPWSVTWRMPDGESLLRMHVLGQQDTEVIRTWAPGIFPSQPPAAHIVARRRSDGRPLTSTFVTLREPIGATPSVIEGVQGAELLDAATTDDGSLRLLASLNLVLFQAEDFGGEVSFRLHAPEAGSYYLHIAPWRSPRYGAVRFALDGDPVGRTHVATGPTVAAGPPLTMGPFELAAGEHTLTVTTVDAGEGDPWISFRAIGLSTKAAPDRAPTPPAIASITAIPTDAVAAVAVERKDGTTERYLYAGTPGGSVTAGEIALDGCFAQVRSEGQRTVGASLIGRSLSTPDLQLSLAHGEHSGRIARIDYERNLVYVDAALPTDDRLRFQTVIFDRPEYSRSTSYTIHDVRREGDLSVIDLGNQRIILGEGTVDQQPTSPTRLTSLTPHDYARRPTFFEGKALTTADFTVQTTIRRVDYAQPFIVDVDSTEGFDAGETFYYLDLRPGDEFVIRNWASLSFEAERPHVVATDDVTLTVAGEPVEFDLTRPEMPRG